MPRSHSARLPSLLLSLILVLAVTQTPAFADEPDHAGHPTKIVGIVSTRLLPSVLVVPNDSAFGWLNYSSGDATIEFDQDITSKLTCRSPGAFRASAGELAAPRIASGEFVSLCSLAPGEYDYKVHVEGRELPLLGKLVVWADE